MAIETERKFLVQGAFKHLVSRSYRITQGYLCTDKGRTVRVRIKGDKGYLTIKGMRSASGLSRYEWEKEIDVQEARELLELCMPTLIDKTRYIVPFGGREFEVDEFYGDNEGLTVAELELESEDAVYERPEWLGEEVTMDRRYNNSYLSNCPYCGWDKTAGEKGK